MNNVQLDMVLGYLNEGTEIDEINFLVESLDEMVNEAFNESTMITSLLEAEDEIIDADYREIEDEKKVGLGTKIVEAIKRFINWVKSLLAKLKNQITKLAVKSLIPKIEKNVNKQLEQLKDADTNTEIKLNKFESAVLYQNDLVDPDKNLFADSNTSVYSEFHKLFAKTPKFIILMSPKLATIWNVSFTKGAKVTITIGKYIEKAKYLDEYAKLCWKNLDEAQTMYNKAITEANKFYKEDPTEANKTIKEATSIMNATTVIASGSIKSILTMLKLTGRKL